MEKFSFKRYASTIFLGVTLALILIAYWTVTVFWLNPPESEQTETRITETVRYGSPEYEFMQRIHNMTHQKVYATQKWGHEEITYEAVDEMYKSLDETNYKNEEFYREVLEAWRLGDFSNAVDVHNTIWIYQDGNVGKATRLLTKEEEEKYKAKHFDEY